MRQQKAKEERRILRDKKTKKSKLKEWEMDYEFYIGEGLVRYGFVLELIVDLFYKIFN